MYEPDDERIPPVVKKQRGVGRKAGEGPTHLVQFFDKSSQWYARHTLPDDDSSSHNTLNRQWMGASRLLLLGEDNGEQRIRTSWPIWFHSDSCDQPWMPNCWLRLHVGNVGRQRASARTVEMLMRSYSLFTLSPPVDGFSSL